MRVFVKYSLLILFVWFFGFLLFIHDVMHFPVDGKDQTDGIVVLTGGRGRISSGVEMLRQNLAKRLLITGINTDVRIQDLLGSEDFGLLHRIDAGYLATNTVGNAVEAVSWVKRHRMKSIYLVTADYHLRRSMIEFSARLPDVKILPQGVPMTTRDVINPGMIMRLAREFNKLIASSMRCLLVKLMVWDDK